MKENINVPKGVFDGVSLRLAGKGSWSQHGDSGDLLVKVIVRPHPYFKRDGANIFTDKYISVTQAILGGTVKVTTLAGERDIVIVPGTSEGQT